MSTFVPYGTREHAYCLAPAGEASVVVEEGKTEGSALSRVCPFLNVHLEFFFDPQLSLLTEKLRSHDLWATMRFTLRSWLLLPPRTSQKPRHSRD